MNLPIEELFFALQFASVAVPIIILIALIVGYYRGWKIWETYME